MTSLSADLPSAAAVLAAAPPLRAEAGARQRIRDANVGTGRRIAVIDDDPTGSQTVHDVSVVTVFDDAEYASALADAASTCFILTNTRSLPDAARENSYPAPLAAAQLYLAGRRAGLGRRDDSSVIDVLRGPSPGSG
jgi:Sugar-binding N-terminal domain